ncbi:MAG: MATE family efflux transporter [Eubacterium sp.]|nr:MATE family efflux transporter [Eubacterium sp.]
MKLDLQKDISIYKKALRLAVPMMIQSGIANAVVLVDNLMVGSLGTERITGVSISAQILFVFNLAVFGGLSGPGIYGAQYFGHGDKEGFAGVFRLKLWIAFLITFAGIAVLFFGGPFLIRLYLTGEGSSFDPSLAMKYGLEYLDIMLAGLIPFTLTQVFAGSFRETNHSLEPMVAGLISVAVDIIFNYLLIYGKAGLPALGVRGAAIATVLSRFVELAVIAGWRKARSDEYPYLAHVFDTLRISTGPMKPIILKSIPIFCNEFLWAAGVAALAQCYSRKGLAVVAGLNIANVLCNLLNVVFINLGAAAGILEGQFLGASEFDTARDSALKLVWFNGLACVLLSFALIVLSGIFPRAYNTTAEVRELARSFIIILAVFFPIQGMMNTLYFVLRSGGKTMITFVFDSVFSWTISVPLAYILCRFSPLSILVILAIVQGAELIKVVFGYYLVRKGIWITNLVS